MRTIRIHVDRQDLATGTEIGLPEAAVAHAVRVLRLRVGARLALFNGDGKDYEAELIALGQREARARIVSARVATNESPLRITLAQALARGEKMDLIVQKATELGVAEIVPLVTERSEVKLDATRADKRLEHWNAVAISACEQSGRARVPQLHLPQTMEDWLNAWPDEGATRLALLPEGGVDTRALGMPKGDTVIAVGPEGGFGERDVAALRAAGFRGWRLGPRVLRTETAGPAALAALQALYGDL